MNGHTRLVKRNTTYYVRARIPSALTYLTKSVQFNYSLQTHNYYEALARVRKESYKIDLKINLLKALDMKIRTASPQITVKASLSFKRKDILVLIFKYKSDKTHTFIGSNFQAQSRFEALDKFPLRLLLDLWGHVI